MHSEINNIMPDRVWEGLLDWGERMLDISYPQQYAYRRGENYVVQIMCPGFSKEDITIKTQKPGYVVVGKSSEARKWSCKNFAVSVFIPSEFDAQKGEASVDCGVCVIEVPAKLPEQNTIPIS